MLDTPDVSDTSTNLPGTESLGSDVHAVKSSKQDQVTIGWEQPTADNIDGECERLFIMNDYNCYDSVLDKSIVIEHWFIGI